MTFKEIVNAIAQATDSDKRAIDCIMGEIDASLEAEIISKKEHYTLRTIAEQIRWTLE